MLNTTGSGFTHVGLKRHTNEDEFLVDDGLGLYVVSDGMGGHAAGEIAAQIAVATVAQHVRGQATLLQGIRSGELSESLLSPIVRIAVARANRAILQRAQAERSLRGMGCTLTVLLMGRTKAAFAHVGDSRLYRERSGRMAQLTVDHTVAEKFALRGLITREQIPLVPQGHALVRAVGVQKNVDIDEKLFSVTPGDRFVLCSDGVWGYLEHTRDMQDFLEFIEAEQVAESLVDFANSCGGQDNATAVYVEARASQEKRTLRGNSSLESATTARLGPVVAGAHSAQVAASA